jgi:Fur family ferric uptake transcriptional regulator
MRKANQQKIVLDVLRAADGPLSAKELWTLLDETGIGLATVYRALHRGMEDGSLTSVEVSRGSIRYEPADRGHHHHFLCSTCDHAFDLAGCVEGLDSLVPKEFHMTSHEVVVFGTCSTCGERS